VGFALTHPLSHGERGWVSRETVSGMEAKNERGSRSVGFARDFDPKVV